MSTSARHLSSRRSPTHQLLPADQSSHEPPTSSLGGVFGSWPHWWTCVVRPSAARSRDGGRRAAHPNVAVARERAGAAAAEVLGAARVRRAVRCRGRREERGERERGEEGEAGGEHHARRVCGKTARDAGNAEPVPSLYDGAPSGTVSRLPDPRRVAVQGRRHASDRAWESGMCAGVVALQRHGPQANGAEDRQARVLARRHVPGETVCQAMSGRCQLVCSARMR
jgi:hypothetical protein